MSAEGRRPFDFTPEELEAELAYWGPKWRQYYEDHKDDPPYEPPSDHTTPDRYYPSPSPGPSPRLLQPAIAPAESIVPQVNGNREPIMTRSSARVGTHFIELDNSPKGKARGSTFAYIVTPELSEDDTELLLNFYELRGI
ncbi:hypothetical protein Q9189_005352 [Teloschistes chrysophthalmus]